MLFFVLKAPKRGARAPAAVARRKTEKVAKPLFEKRPKQFGIRGALPPKKDLTRFLRRSTSSPRLDKNLATNLFKMLLKYRPEDKAAKKERHLKRAQAEAKGKASDAKKPIVVKYSLQHVTCLVEQKLFSAEQGTIVAHNVDPIELVVWLPALCRKMEIPYCIVKGKSRLGVIVHKKTTSVLCLTSVKNEDKLEFSKVLEAIKVIHNFLQVVQIMIL
ncbi:unnamed protein product [Coffea canephora]|uniref:DH200=94 genomic scaffold, scaffold_7025 n=1 Tax=Coffea canephora TaxID=49390 RepID=A0A068VM07_COFCA|nr:unnamed protein product [Coffea canephora]